MSFASVHPGKRDRYVPKEGGTETSTDKRRQAHLRLDELLDLAEQQKMYGQVGVLVFFENGTPTVVRKNLEGTYK